MKRNLFLVLISILLVFSLVGCGEKEVGDKENEQEIGYKAYAQDAQFFAFVQEFGDFEMNFKMSNVSDVLKDTMMSGLATSKVQQYYLAANGLKYGEKEFNEALEKIIPAPSNNKCRMTETIFKALEYDRAGKSIDEMPAYVINVMPEGYDTNTEFYDNANGKEVYYITANGNMFTLPGYPREMNDNSIRFYITPNHYYSVINKSTKTAADVDENGLNYLEKPIISDDFTHFEAVKK